jgi:SAM-dependent methyltransferase
MEDFNDPATARQWSANPVSHNPTRLEQLDILLSILESEYRSGTSILDIGFGSGLVEEMIFKRLRGAHVVGVDGAPAMVALADERLVPYRDQYETVIRDLTEISSLRLPEREYSAAISVQTIHNVADPDKRETFRFIYKVLAPGGLFLLMDRIAIDTPGLFDVYKALWSCLARVHGGDVDLHEGADLEEHRQIVSTRGDQPATLQQHLDWLRDIGFEVALVHLHANRALFAARKPEA